MLFRSFLSSRHSLYFPQSPIPSHFHSVSHSLPFKLLSPLTRSVNEERQDHSTERLIRNSKFKIEKEILYEALSNHFDDCHSNNNKGRHWSCICTVFPTVSTTWRVIIQTNNIAARETRNSYRRLHLEPTTSKNYGC